jgi:hypothetical protein
MFAKQSRFVCQAKPAKPFVVMNGLEVGFHPDLARCFEVIQHGRQARYDSHRTTINTIGNFLPIL